MAFSLDPCGDGDLGGRGGGGRARGSNNTHGGFESGLWDMRWRSATCDCIKNDWLSLKSFGNS